MVDYHTHIAALRVLEAELAQLLAANPDPALKLVNAAVLKNPSYAALGAVIDRLFEHAGDANRELSLLTEAAGIYQQISQLLAQIAQIRQQFESLVLNPGQANMVDTLNTVGATLDTFKPKLITLTAQLQGLFAELRLLNHVTTHGQELDHPVQDWTWKDKLLSRRTGAFTHGLKNLAQAEGGADLLAFAYGAISSYAANVTGSSYLSQTVRGPRRSHPIRDRVAEYSTGAWLRNNQPQLTLSIANLRSLLTFGSPQNPQIPHKLVNLINKALDQAFAGKLGPNPDLQKAYTKLIQHLDLLNSFPTPPVPQPIDNTLWGKIQTLQPQDISGGSPPSPGQSGANPSPGSPTSNIPWWAWVLFAVCIAIVALLYFLGIAGPANPNPYPGPFQNDPQGIGQATSYLTSDAAYVQANVLFNMHVALWELAVYGLKTLKLLGLLYPESNDLAEPQFSQFTSVPTTPFNAFRKPIADPNLFLSSPNSSSENPVMNIAPYPNGSSPLVLLFGTGASAGVNSYGKALWNTEAHGRDDSDLRRVNRNLDGDRGFEHACWKLKSGSIMANPLPVVIMNYNDI